MNPDETTPQEMDINEAVATLLRELPKPVQDFVTGPERARVALSLSQKYNLHADQAGEFEHAFMFMLLGVSSPEEFVDSLTRAGILPETVRKLVTDVNEQVFVPLRKAEQGSTPALAPAAAPVPTAPRPAPVSVPPAPILPGSTEPVPQAMAFPQTQAMPQPQAFPQQASYPYAQAPMPPQMMYPAPPAYGMPYGAPVYMWPQQPVPAPYPYAQAPMPPQYPYPQQMAAPYQQVTPVPEPTPIPAPPVKAPAVENPRPAPPPPPPVVARPVFTPQSTPTPLQKDYGADPYREPFN